MTTSADGSNDGNSSTPWTPSLRERDTATTFTSNGRQSGDHRRSDSARAEDQYRLVRKRFMATMQPDALVLRTDEAREPTQSRNGQANRQFGGAGLVDTARVTQRHPARDLVEEVVVAGSQSLDNLRGWASEQSRQRPKRDRGTQVRRRRRQPDPREGRFRHARPVSGSQLAPGHAQPSRRRAARPTSRAGRALKNEFSDPGCVRLTSRGFHDSADDGAGCLRLAASDLVGDVG